MIPRKVKVACEEVDVFKMEDAEVLWHGSFSSLEAATARINQLLVSDPGEYFTHIPSTGNKVFFKANGHNGHNGRTGQNGHNGTR